jgi:hypothetical protein
MLIDGKQIKPGTLPASALLQAGSSPIWWPPSLSGLAPGAMDDEFDSTTLDPNWQFWDAVNNVVRTPSQGLDMFTAFAAPTTVPRYTVHTAGAGARKSWFRWQVPNATATYYVTKPATLAVGSWMFARLRVGGWAPNDTIAAGSTCVLTLAGTVSGHPDSNTLVYVGANRVAGNVTMAVRSIDSGASGPNNYSVSNVANSTALPYVGIYRKTSTTYSFVMFGEDGHVFHGDNEAGGGAQVTISNIGTLNRVGVIVSANNGGGTNTTPVQVFGMDFLRESTSLPF